MNIAPTSNGSNTQTTKTTANDAFSSNVANTTTTATALNNYCNGKKFNNLNGRKLDRMNHLCQSTTPLPSIAPSVPRPSPTDLVAPAVGDAEQSIIASAASFSMERQVSHISSTPAEFLSQRTVLPTPTPMPSGTGLNGAAKEPAVRTTVGCRSSAAVDFAQRTKRGASKRKIGEKYWLNIFYFRSRSNFFFFFFLNNIQQGGPCVNMCIGFFWLTFFWSVVLLVLLLHPLIVQL